MILTGRFHGCVIGQAMGRKVLAVSGDRKVESFMAAGLGEAVLGLDDAALLRDRLEALPGQPTRPEFLARARRGNEQLGAPVRGIVTPGPRAGRGFPNS